MAIELEPEAFEQCIHNGQCSVVKYHAAFSN